jgi:hypothetical protein
MLELLHWFIGAVASIYPVISDYDLIDSVYSTGE